MSTVSHLCQVCGLSLMVGFGREDTLTRARSDLGPSNLLGVRWKRIILGES
jgi:hypothetical protein